MTDKLLFSGGGFTQTCGRCGNQEEGPWMECSVCGWVPPEELIDE